MIAEQASAPPLEADDAPNRRLWTRIVIANVIAWVAIIIMVRLVFF